MAKNFLEFGSPPRMWGTPAPSQAHCPKRRFTPTHVGNTVRSSRARRFMPVHPHACGEHAVNLDFPRDSSGSPPRMWGTLNCFDQRLAYQRFTPTHVGNTPVKSIFFPVKTVHPHACGEHVRHAGEFLFCDGSPPRMWGTLAVLAPERLGGGSPPRMWGTRRGPKWSVQA